MLLIENIYRNIKISFIFLYIIIPVFSTQVLSTEIENPEHIKSIWTGTGQVGAIGPSAGTITETINEVKEAFRNLDEEKDFDSQSKGVIAEAASVAFFMKNNWQPWDTGNCTLGKCFSEKVGGYQGAEGNGFQGKGSDNGIDGLFTQKIMGIDYLIINESKYRTHPRVNLQKNDFGKLADNTRQSSSEWNKKHIRGLGFTNIKINSTIYNGTNYSIIRSSTFLNSNGKFDLYFIKNERNNLDTNKNILSGLNQIPSSAEFISKVNDSIGYIR